MEIKGFDKWDEMHQMRVMVVQGKGSTIEVEIMHPGFRVAPKKSCETGIIFGVCNDVFGSRLAVPALVGCTSRQCLTVLQRGKL